MERAAVTTRPLAVLPTLEGSLELYARDLAGEKKSPATVRTYLAALRGVGTWIGGEPTPADITPARIRAYLAAHSHQEATTLRKALTAVRSYSHWCIQEGIRADDPTIGIKWPRLPERIPRALTSDQLLRLEQILSSRPRRALNLRTRRLVPVYKLIVLLMLYAGLRRQEVSGLRWDDIDLARKTLLVRGKGDRERLLPIHPRLDEALRKVPPAERKGFVVASSRTGGQRKHKAMGIVFEVWLAGEGLEISAHQLRHTFASQLLEYEADLEQIRELLGHKSLRDTQIYLRLLVRRKRAAVLKLPHTFTSGEE